VDALFGLFPAFLGMAVGTQHLHVVHLVVTAGPQGNDVIDLGCKWQQFFAALALPFLVVSPRTPK